MEENALTTLIFRSHQDDKEAYRELLTWLWDHSISRARYFLKYYRNFPSEALEDIAQDVLLTFHQTHQTYDNSRPILPWINTIIKYKAIDHIRKKEFKSTMSAIDLELIQDLLSIPEEMHTTEELSKLINELPTDQANALRLSKLEGLSGREVAEKLGLSESNVKVLIHRGIKALKSKISSLQYRTSAKKGKSPDG